MATTYDLMNFSIVRNGSVSVSVPRFTITCNVVNSQTGALFKTINTNFPALLTTFTNAEQEELLITLINKMIEIKAPQ